MNAVTTITSSDDTTTVSSVPAITTVTVIAENETTVIEGQRGPQGATGDKGDKGDIGPTGASSTVMDYSYVNTITAPPGSGQVRFNNANPTLATLCYVDDVTAPGTAVSIFLRLIAANDEIVLQDKDDATKWQHFRVTADVIERTGYFEIPLVFSNGGAALSDGQRVLFEIRTAGPPVPLAAPTKKITLTVQNGTLNGGTAMPSDAAPALDVTIQPTWSAVHTFSNTSGQGAVRLASATPAIGWNESTAATDAKWWRTRVGSSSMTFDLVNDANSSSKNWLTVTRAVLVVSSLTFGNATDNPTYSFLGTGTATFSGAAAFNAAVTFNNTELLKGLPTLQSNYPALRFNDTDLTATTGGLWQYSVANDRAQWLRNTAAAGDFSTYTQLLDFSPTAFNFGNTTDNPAFNFLGTGLTTFGGGAKFSSSPIISSATPTLQFNETDQATDLKNWIIRGNASGLQFGIANDASPASMITSAMTLARSATGVTGLSFGNATDNPTYSFLGTGAVTFGGAANYASPLTITAATPSLRHIQTGAGTNAGNWNTYASATRFNIAAADDTFTGHTVFLQALRKANSINVDTLALQQADHLSLKGLVDVLVDAPTVNFGNATTNPTFNFLGTGATTFNGQAKFASGTSNLGDLYASGNFPQIGWNQTTGAADGKNWTFVATGGGFVGKIYNDALNASKDWLAVIRTGYAVTSLTFGNSTDNPAYTFLGTGALTRGNAGSPREVMANGAVSLYNDGGGNFIVYNTANSAFYGGMAVLSTQTRFFSQAGQYITLTGPSVRFNGYGAGTLVTDASGNITASSDARIKRNVRRFVRGLADVLKLRPVMHGYTEASGLETTRDDYVGFLAQHVRAVIPEAVGVDPSGMLTLNDRAILAALVNAVIELAGNQMHAAA